MDFDNEYGDMDQVVYDFRDWWDERALRFRVEMDRNWHGIIRLYEFEARSCAIKLFGHDDFICPEKEE